MFSKLTAEFARHVLARPRRLRQRGARGRLSRRRHRIARRVAGVRSHGGDRGVCARPDLGRSFQSRRLGRPVGGRALSRQPAAAVHRGAGHRRHRAAPACCTSSPAASADFSLAGGFASNGYGAHSPGGYSLAAALVCEVVMTFMFLIVILGTTHKRAPVGFAGLAIGLGAHADPSDQHPGDEHLGESGAQHGDRAVRRRLGASAALAVLAGAGDRRRTRRLRIQGGARGPGRGTPGDRTRRSVVGIPASQKGRDRVDPKRPSVTRYAAEGASSEIHFRPAPAAGSSYSRSPISDFGSTAASTRRSSMRTEIPGLHARHVHHRRAHRSRLADRVHVLV